MDAPGTGGASLVETLCSSARAIRSVALAVVLAGFVSAPVARAVEEAATPRSWYVGIATGWYFPIEKWSSSYYLGGGGVLLLGYQLLPSISLRLEVNMSLLAGDRNDTWNLRVTPEIKWDLGSWRLKPFLWTGAGLPYQVTYPGPASSATLVIPIGIGIEWELDSAVRVFVQANYDLLVESLTVQSIPALGGFEVHF